MRSKVAASRSRGGVRNVNVVVLEGTETAEPVQRRMPSGDEVTQLRTVNVAVLAYSDLTIPSDVTMVVPEGGWP